MKKLFLFTCLSALALSFNSCSKDDGPGKVKNINDNGAIGTISFKVGGVQKTFTTGTIYEQVAGVGLNPVYKVTAFDNENASERIYFEIKKGDTEDNSIYVLQYTYENRDYFDSITVDSKVDINDGSTLKGTFKAYVIWTNDEPPYQSDQKVVSNGSFEIDLQKAKVI